MFSRVFLFAVFLLPLWAWSAGTVIGPADAVKITPGTLPATGREGELRVDSGTGELNIYDSGWVSVGGAGGDFANVSLTNIEDTEITVSLRFRDPDGAAGPKYGMIWMPEAPNDGPAASIMAERTGVSGAPHDLIFSTTDSHPAISQRLRILSDGEIRFFGAKNFSFFDADDSNFVALKAPSIVGTNFVLNLPAADGTSGQALVTDGAGILSFATVSTDLENVSVTITPSADAVYDLGKSDKQFKDGWMTALKAALDLTVTTGDDLILTPTDEISISPGGVNMWVAGEIKLPSSWGIDFYDQDSTNFATMYGPSNITGNYSMQLPPDDGPSDPSYLVGDGDGVLTFETLHGRKLTADPCGDTTNYKEGTIFYNDTSDYFCFCNGAGNDVQMHAPIIACF